VTDEPSVSVVIPVHNDGVTLRRCLEALRTSIRRSGLTRCDVTVVDDGSAEPVTLDDPGDAGVPVRVLQNETNRGQSYSRNRGARSSEADYLLFLDSDAVVEASAMEHVAEFVRGPRREGLIGMQGLFSLSHPYRDWSSQIYNIAHVLADHPHRYNRNVNGSFFLIERAEFARIGMFREDLRFLEDCEFGRRMAAQGCYLQNGPASFVHHKRATWPWVVHGVVLGGMSQGRMLASPPAAPTGPVVAAAPPNNVFRNWLLQSALALAGGLGFALAAPSHPRWIWLVLAGPALVSAARMCGALWRARPNPGFCAVGVLTLFGMPWLIGLGVALGRFRPVGRRQIDHWQRSRTR
jgi:hypothetical protein